VVQLEVVDLLGEAELGDAAGLVEEEGGLLEDVELEGAGRLTPGVGVEGT
jgi:hypothetical protein